MVKKAQKKSPAPPPAPAAVAGGALLDSQFAQLVKDSAQQIWSAGLAAFAKAQGRSAQAQERSGDVSSMGEGTGKGKADARAGGPRAKAQSAATRGRDARTQETAATQSDSGQAFDRLVAEGARLQAQTRQGGQSGAGAGAEDRLGSAAHRLSDMAGEVGTRAGQHWDKLESIFEDRVARAMGRLNVPTAADFDALNERLEALTAAVQALSAGRGVAPPSAAPTSEGHASASTPKPKGKSNRATIAQAKAPPTAQSTIKSKAKSTTKRAAKSSAQSADEAGVQSGSKSTARASERPKAKSGGKAIGEPAAKPLAKSAEGRSAKLKAKGKK